ncbi:MAG: hypothetical protein ACR2OH_01225 [Microthrixaceae bacterium]
MIVGVGADAAIRDSVVTELDPTAAAYRVPEGWLATGDTAVGC